MEALRSCSLASVHIPPVNKTQLAKPMFVGFQINLVPTSFQKNRSKFKAFAALSSSPNTTESMERADMELKVNSDGEKFDWYSHWYPIMPECDLDKRVPHAKKVLGIDVVVWWDRNESAWKVFDDSCPHRLAPLSEGRIDQSGRLQCVYHGWCFSGSGDCKFIPQAPPDGPPVHTFKQAGVAVYPSTLHQGVVWFWPSTDPQYKDVITKKKPPSIPELDDPSFTILMGNRDIPYGYEIFLENLMDPAHVPYSHYGLIQTVAHKDKADREGGRPLDISVKKLDVNGFFAKQGLITGKFTAPCVYHYTNNPVLDEEIRSVTSAEDKKVSSPQRIFSLIILCVPVSPGNCRLIWCFPRNFAIWIDKIVPRWLFHITNNLILDSDMYLLHLEERKIEEVGAANWQKACFVPTKSDAMVVSFRRWFNKYGGGQVDWRAKFSGALPPTPPREQLLDRYWTHVVNCRSCNGAYKVLNAVEVTLQVLSIVSIGVVAATKQNLMSAAGRTAMVLIAVICFAASRWLAHFIHKNFHYHGYNHALV